MSLLSILKWSYVCFLSCDMDSSFLCFLVLVAKSYVLVLISVENVLGCSVPTIEKQLYGTDIISAKLRFQIFYVNYLE